MNLSRRLLVLAGLFTALMVIGARLKIPFPIVPLTLQPFFVLLSGLFLGPVYGAASQIAYVFLGLIGFPVFSEGGGLAYVLKPSFGYLIGFPFASFIAGLIVHRRLHPSGFLPAVTLTRLLFANFAALFTIFLPGVFYLWLNFNFMLQQPLSLTHAIYLGFLRFVPGDLIKIAGVTLLYRALQPRLAVLFTPVAQAPNERTAETIMAEK